MNDQLPPPQPTVASLLPVRARQVIYALLGVAQAGYVTAAATYDLPAWHLIIVAMVNGAGFTLAVANTRASR